MYFNPFNFIAYRTAMKTILLTISSAFLLLSCNNTRSGKNDSFHFPYIKNIKDYYPKESDRVDSLSMADNPFIGKYSFADTIDLSHPKKLIDSIDYTRERTHRVEYNLPLYGLETFIDTTTVITYHGKSYYPMYVVNQTNSDKFFSTYHIILEAEYKYHGFYPIECTGTFFCGNSWYLLKIKPKEFALVLIRKYEGKIKTRYRVNIANEDNIIKSLPFNGTINSGQFFTRYNGISLNEYNSTDISSAFNKSIPWEIDSLNMIRR